MRQPGPITRSDRNTHDRIDVEMKIRIRGSRNYDKWITRSVAADAPVTQAMFRRPLGLVDLILGDRTVCSYRWPDQ